MNIMTYEVIYNLTLYCVHFTIFAVEKLLFEERHI